MSVISIKRDTNNNVSLVRMQVTDALATVNTANYILNNQDAIDDLNDGVWEWFITDMILVAASDGNAFFQFTNSTFASLMIYGEQGSGTVNPAAINSVAYYAATGSSISGLAVVNNAILATNNTGVPAETQTLPAAVQSNITAVGIIASGTWNGSTIDVAHGGTGNTTFTAYSVICAGITATGAFQNVSGLGTTGQILTSNGAGVLPTWQTNAASGTVSSGLQNQLAYYAANGTTVSGLTTGNSGALITSGLGVPSISSTLPTTVQGNITQLGAQSQALNMNTHLVNNVVDPVNPQDAATKNYVDQTALNGTSVYAASAATLGTVTQSGAGVGATLTNAGVQATFALDGVNPPVGSNVLIKNTATGMTAANEGIYTVTSVGSGATNWVLTRASSYDTPTEINNTGLIVVQNGTTLAGTAWYNAATIVTVDTTNFSYSEFGNIVFPITVAHGGTGLSSLTAYGLMAGGTTSTGNMQQVTIGAAGTILQSGGSAALPTYTTTTYPSTNAINTIMYASSANVLGVITPVNSAVMVSSGGGVPSMSTTLPAGLTIPGYAASGANADITSMSGLTGYLQAPLGVKDSNGNIVVTYTGVASAVNYLQFANATAAAPTSTISAQGSSSNVNVGIASKNGYVEVLDGTHTISGRLLISNAADTHHTSLSVNTTQATDLDLILPAVDGSAGFPLTTNGSAITSFANPIAAAAMALLGGSGMSYSTFTIFDLSTASGGTAVISNIGFTPSLCLVLATVPGGSTASWGMDNGSTSLAIAANSGGVPGVFDVATSSSIYAITGVGANQKATVAFSSGTNGTATFTFTKTGSPTGNLYILPIFFK